MAEGLGGVRTNVRRPLTTQLLSLRRTALALSTLVLISPLGVQLPHHLQQGEVVLVPKGGAVVAGDLAYLGHEVVGLVVLIISAIDFVII